MTKIPLTDDWNIAVIPYGGVSPMSNHQGGSEIAVDKDSKLFYVWETWLVTVGIESVITACNQFSR